MPAKRFGINETGGKLIGIKQSWNVEERIHAYAFTLNTKESIEQEKQMKVRQIVR